MTVALAVIAVVAVFILIILAAAIRILREYERGVIFRLGRLIAQKGPGLILLIPFIDQMVRIDLRTITLNVPPQEVITKDNVTVRVNAVAYFRVIDPNKAVTEVENFLLATSQIAQTTLRSVLGKAELDALLSERERLNVELQQIIDEQTEPWGIKVSTVEVKDVELPADMQRAMSRQAEAERERRAKIIAADGEFQAAEKLSQAANIISLNPATLQLRYLQTLVEIGVNNSSTIVFPLPLDLLKPLLEPHADAERAAAGATAPRRRRHRSAAPSPERSPEIRIEQLTGLRAILAPGRAERPDAFDPRPAEPRPDAAESCPFCEGREDRTPPEVWANRPGGGEPDTPGLDGALGAQPLPGARRRRRGAATRTERPATESGFASSIDPLGASTRGAGRPVSLAAGDRRPRGDRQRARARDLARRSSPDERLAGAVAAWRERMRAHADAAYLHLIVNEGPDAGGSLEHTHAQLYALGFVPRRDRPRARARGRLPRAHDGRAPARGRRDRGGAPPRAAGRGRRRRAAGLPVGVALAVRAAGDPAPPGAAVRGRTRAARR